MMIKFGDLKIDPAAYGSQGNAVLGIRDSGKTYTATYLAERLFESGVPFVTFDPTGVWRFIRVPGRGKGYPVVVAGGEGADLPLTEASAPKIVEAAMQSGVSLVINLFDEKLSKASWRRIVKDSIGVLIHKNHKYGLRHIFLEEAAEFVPQKVLDGDVYAVIEKLARMGGNFRLGYTLINQRSQEVNKAVLELCENLFLHRQRGKNALENLKKWLEVASDHDAEKVMKSISTLDTGKCWAWMGGADPLLISVPAKNSFHPDRRVMHGAAAAVTAKAVDVGAFVQGLKSALPALEAESAANDPVALRKRIADLEKALASKSAPQKVAKPDQNEIQRWRAEGYRDGVATERAKVGSVLLKARRSLDAISKALATAGVTVGQLDEVIQAEIRRIDQPTSDIKPASTTTAKRDLPVYDHRPAPHTSNAPIASGKPTGSAAERIKRAVKWWADRGNNSPTRVQVAFLARYSPKSSGYEKQLSTLSSAGYIHFPAPGCVALTDLNSVASPEMGSTLDAVRSVLDPRMWRVLDPLLDQETLDRETLAERSSYSAASSGYEKTLSQMKSLSVIEFPAPRMVKAASWLFEG